MKFSFKIQQYQTEAVEAVVNVFRGQGLHTDTVYKRDLGSIEDTREETQLSLFEKSADYDDDIYSDTGFKNENVQLSDEQLAELLGGKVFHVEQGTVI